MLHRMRTQAKGFTLLELLIVVAIIGVLAAIAIPNFVSAAAKSKYGRTLADTKTIVSQATIYNVDNPGTFPTLANLMGGTYMSYAKDPFATTGCDAAVATGCYKYTAATATTPVSAHTIGTDATDNNAAWAGAAAITGDDVGVSSTIGCSVGAGASSYAKC